MKTEAEIIEEIYQEFMGSSNEENMLVMAKNAITKGIKAGKEINEKSKEDFIKAVGGDESKIKESIRDIITRYERVENMGGYSAEFLEFLVDWMMEYWTFITHHFRKEVEQWKKDQEIKLINQGRKQLTEETLKIVDEFDYNYYEKGEINLSKSGAIGEALVNLREEIEKL